MVLHTKGCNGQSVTRERNRRHALVTVYLSHHAIIEENVRNYIVIPLTDFEFFRAARAQRGTFINRTPTGRQK